MRDPQQPDRPTRPTKLGEAVRLVDQIYRENEWGEIEQASHQRMIGLKPMPLGEMTKDEVKTIVADFEESRMVIFRN